MADKKSVVVRCKLKWSYLRRKNDMSQKYQLDCTELDAKAVKALKAIGLVARQGKDKKTPDPDSGWFVTPKSMREPMVVDSGLNTVPDEIADAVGNGTVADVEIDAYSAPKADGGVAPGLLGVKIVELVAYTNSSSLEAEDGGFTVPVASTALAGGPTGADDDVPF